MHPMLARLLTDRVLPDGIATRLPEGGPPPRRGVRYRPEADITARRNLRHMALSDARIAPVQECIPRDLAVAETAVVVAPVQ